MSKQYLKSMVSDQIYSFRQLSSKRHKDNLKNVWFLNHSEYIAIMPPGLLWLMKSVAKIANKELFQGILHEYRDNCNDSMVLNVILESFDASYYSHSSLGMIKLVGVARISSSTASDLLNTLGKQLLIHPPREDHKIQVLNEVWKTVSKCEDVSAYIMCCATWIEMTCVHYSEREVRILLSDLNKRFDCKMPELSDKVLGQLESTVLLLLSGEISLRDALLQADNFLKIIDTFRIGRKLEICKEVLLQCKNYWMS